MALSQYRDTKSGILKHRNFDTLKGKAMHTRENRSEYVANVALETAPKFQRYQPRTKPAQNRANDFMAGFCFVALFVFVALI